jgi:hypothetical protein
VRLPRVPEAKDPRRREVQEPPDAQHPHHLSSPPWTHIAGGCGLVSTEVQGRVAEETEETEHRGEHEERSEERAPADVAGDSEEHGEERQRDPRQRQVPAA